MEALNNNQKEILNKEFILEPTNKWLVTKTIKSIGTENYVFYGKLFNKDNVVIKVLTDANIEYDIYKLVRKFNFYLPNMPKIYGVYNCYENKKILDKITKDYNKNNNKNVKIPLCSSGSFDVGKPNPLATSLISRNGVNDKKNKDNIRLRFIVMEKIKGKTLENIVPKNTILEDDLFISILMQGLYQIYQLYYIFGIVINDYHTGNILIEPTNDDYLDYKFEYNPYRHYEKEPDCFIDDTTYNTKLKLHGFKIYLIDFDNGLLLHSDFRKDTGDIKTNITKQINSFINNIAKFASHNIIKKLKTIYDNKRYIECCQYQLNNYNNIEDKGWIHNEGLIIRTSKIIVTYIKQIVKTFNLPKENILFIN